MHRRRRWGRIWIRNRRRWWRMWIIEMIFSVGRKHSRRRWSSCGIDGGPHRQRDRWIAARVIDFARGILYPIRSTRAILRCQNRVPGDSPLENLRRVGSAPTPISNPNPNPSQFVREIEDTVGLSLGGSNLVAHEPRCAGGSVSDQTGERHAALADDFIAEDEAVVAELKAEEEIVIIGVAWRVRNHPKSKRTLWFQSGLLPSSSLSLCVRVRCRCLRSSVISLFGSSLSMKTVA